MADHTHTPRSHASRLGALASLALCVALVASCGSSKKSSGTGTTTKSGSTGTTAYTPGTVAPQANTGDPTGKIRVANFFYDKSMKGVALDIYDSSSPPADTKPLVADLGFGEVSDYVSPRAAKYSNDANLFAVPAGTRPKDFGGYHRLSNGSFEKSDQITVMLGRSDSSYSDSSADPLAALSISQLIEAGGGSSGTPMYTKPAAGKAQILGDSFPLQSLRIGAKKDFVTSALFIDGACTPATNASSPDVTVPFVDVPLAAFPVKPGKHTLEVSLNGSSTPNCGQFDKQLKTTVDVAEGESLIVFLYALDPAKPQLVTAKIAD